MAGIYIHIPFCRQKCYYCDFYKTVNTSLTDSFLVALKREIDLRKSYLKNQTVETIYFGGGTPSVLRKDELREIMHYLRLHFEIDKDAEITFEANPDDLDLSYLEILKKEGINRLSIGVQSFQDELLKKMNRRHNADQAIRCIREAHSVGFDNISTDLIYGIPGLDMKEWIRSLNIMMDLPIQHLSAYHLTYHEGTAFYTWLKKGTLKASDEEESSAQFEQLAEESETKGFEQYEISNFARNGNYSRHNSAYWQGKDYLGLGPSAHSYNGNSRQWNVSSVEFYIRAMTENKDFYTVEQLDTQAKYNEYILTRIRTIWGVSPEYILKQFGQEYADYFQKRYKSLNRHVAFIQGKNGVCLSKDAWFVSDQIILDLMKV